MVRGSPKLGPDLNCGSLSMVVSQKVWDPPPRPSDSGVGVKCKAPTHPHLSSLLLVCKWVLGDYKFN